MSQPTTRLVNWNRSAVDTGVDCLVAAWGGDSPLDLGDLLVLTQTKGAGRRLRFALARHLDEVGHGMFPPRFSTPSILFAPPAGKPVASEGACLLLWEEVGKETNLAE